MEVSSYKYRTEKKYCNKTQCHKQDSVEMWSPSIYSVSVCPRYHRSHTITKTYLYNFDPLKPHFYIVKLGFTGVYIIFLISAQKHRLWYSLEPPRRGGSNEYPQSMFWAEMWKISELLFENFQFLVVNFSIYLNRRVFVMRQFSGIFSCFSHKYGLAFYLNCLQRRWF